MINKIREKSHFTNAAALLLASVIWGTAFVAQTTGGDAMGAFSFNCIRQFIATLVLIPVIKLLDALKLTGKKPETKEEKLLLLRGGVVSGAALFVASNLQQVGINMGTSTGKAAFLTVIYILLVPILGIFFKKKCPWNVWAGVMLALMGLFLLCSIDITDFNIKLADVLLILCALAFSVQILAIDYYAPKVDNVRLACVQFLTCGILSLIPTFIVDFKHSVSGFIDWLPVLSGWSVWGSLLFAAVLSSGVAYTLQIVGQNNFNPTVASLLMSMESVFSALAGWLFLHQVLSGKEIVGCVLVFAAIILAQLNFSFKPGRKQKR